MKAPPGWWTGRFLERIRMALATHVLTALPGPTWGGWLRLLRENRFRVDPPYWPRAALLTAGSLVNSLLRRVEDRAYGPLLERVQLEPPVFVLGHWRSGTTHLQNLLAQDPSLAAPRTRQVLFPHAVFTGSWVRALEPLLPRTRIVDDLPFGLDLPAEDEFALAATRRSPYLAWVFPRAWDRYERYLTLRDLPDGEVDAWRRGLLSFVRKVSLADGRPLVLKSPPHTARIRLLLALFPGARFVHIHRHPHDVFLSTLDLMRAGLAFARLQGDGDAGLEDRVIRRYRVLHQALFEERGLIPSGRFHELRFDDLERDPLGQMRLLYERLGLSGFDAARPHLERYVAGIRGYRKAVRPPLEKARRVRLAREWAREFEEFGYRP